VNKIVSRLLYSVKKIDMTFQDLLAYKNYFTRVKIFEITKSFPKEETYSLTDQIHRSSRSVPVTMAEAYRKNLPKILYSKLTDSDGETRKQVAEFALSCKYISEPIYHELISLSLEIGKLNYMILNLKVGVKTE
jgi:four helix bundle protein